VFRIGSSPLKYPTNIAETQEMLDFCGEHNIVSEIEIITLQEIYSVVLPSNFASCFDASSLVALTMPSL
jgi:fructose/tagatose bisphosphate aldolase